LEALRQAEAREELKQNNSGRRNPPSSSVPPKPPTEPPPPAPRPPLPNKRKLSPTAVGEPASPPNSSVPLLKRLKVSEEEQGELSISIPEIAASGPLPGVSPGGGVGAALPATPLTSTGGGSRARKKTGSFSVDAVQVS
jgi:hypothetical protein